MASEKDRIKNRKMRELHDFIGLYAPLGTNAFLNDYAKHNGITKTQLIRNAIEEYCNVDLNNNFGLKD